MPRHPITKIKKIKIEKFRALNNITLEFANRITVICGKNGMAKSSILGIIAQPFSFETDYTKQQKLNYKTLSGKPFKSSISEHFKLSQYDKKEKYKVYLEVHDGYEDIDLNNLELDFVLSTDRDYPRPVLRNNSTKFNKNSSRNITHPVIYLSVKRLTPIVERGKYKERIDPYINNCQQEICNLIKNILLKYDNTKITATTSNIPSIVAHSDNYDYKSVSVGDDNIGQIVQAIFSFKKLKYELNNDYHGGLLLIDEADAGLFPAAQQEFIRRLAKICKEYDLQVVMTTHSPTMIEEIYKLYKKASNDYKVLYLSNAYGKIEVFNNFSWEKIIADLNVQLVRTKEGITLPSVNVYVEDKEAADFFNSIINNRKIRKVINLIQADIGATSLLTLAEKKIPEFCKNSIICVDGDQNLSQYNRYHNIIKLPTLLPPDQLIFEHLFNKNNDDPFWIKTSPKLVFLREASSICTKMNINQSNLPLDLYSIVETYRKQASHGEIRSLFKNFYKSDYMTTLLKQKATNPFVDYIKHHPEIKKDFSTLLITALKGILRHRGVLPETLSIYFD